MTLRPPAEPMLAQAAETIPGPAALRAGVAFEQKFDGHRALLFTPTTAGGGPTLVQTRRGALVQDRWPDLVAAAEQLPGGLVLDGELLVWGVAASRLSFEGLQRRAAARARGAAALATGWPAYFVAFDVRQQDCAECLALPYVDRRARLEALFVDHALTAPWTLCPMTTDLAKAREWLESWTDAAWGSRDVLDVVLVRPEVVAEVSADRAVDHAGVYRHPRRFQRLRLDVTAADVVRFGAGPAAAAD
ncbi:hypothetical protein [Streptomyces sp. NPDC093225]|uniref:ATP-dependent DNA ligase n=1 Tax=Streptomyces sp. NPDC093225 TaxID=3366034 RepID=UPI003826F83F